MCILTAAFVTRLLTLPLDYRFSRFTKLDVTVIQNRMMPYYNKGVSPLPPIVKASAEHEDDLDGSLRRMARSKDQFSPTTRSKSVQPRSPPPLMATKRVIIEE